jgi:hypothetical protein
MSITSTRKNVDVKPYLEDQVTTVGYGYAKNVVVELPINDPMCLMKYVHTVNPQLVSDYYYVLVGQNGDLYNPFNTPLQRSQILGQDKFLGNKYWNFKKVTKDMYDFYFRYLNTKNTLYFNEIEKLLQTI